MQAIRKRMVRGKIYMVLLTENDPTAGTNKVEFFLFVKGGVRTSQSNDPEVITRLQRNERSNPMAAKYPTSATGCIVENINEPKPIDVVIHVNSKGLNRFVKANFNAIVGASPSDRNAMYCEVR
jgi:hypothetical protein